MDYAILATSSIASLSTYHQIFTIYQNKSSKDMSFIHIISVFFNMLFHMIYAIEINNKNLIITFTNGTAAMTFLIMIASYYYIKKPLQQIPRRLQEEIEEDARSDVRMVDMSHL